MGSNSALRNSVGSWLSTGRKSLAVLKVPAITLCVAAAAYGLELLTLSSHNPFKPLRPGTWSSVIEWAAEGLAVYVLWKKPASPARRVGSVLAFAMACNLAADFFYWVWLYQCGLQNDNPRVVFSSESLYAVVFASIAYAMVEAWERPRRAHLRSSAAIVIVVFATVLLATAIAHPMIKELSWSTEHGKHHDLSLSSHLWYHVVQSLCVSSAWILLLISGITFVSSSSQFWTTLSAATGTLVLADWAMRVEQYLRGDPQVAQVLTSPAGLPNQPGGMEAVFGYYEVFWLASVVAIALTCYFYKPEVPTRRFDGGRLVSGVKLAIIAALALPVASTVAFDLLALDSSKPEALANPLRLALVGCSLSLFVAAAVSNYLSEHFTRFAAQLGEEGSGDPGFSGELQEWYEQFVKERTNKRKVEAAERIALAKRQLAHDILSPASALEALLLDPKAADNLPRHLSVARSAVQRIMDMAKALLRETPNDAAGRAAPDAMGPLLETMVSEKRVECQQGGVEITLRNQAPEACANVNPPLFFRAMSNLINNAVQALGGDGRVAVTLSATDETVTITIEDNGIGIAPENIAAIQQGFSTKIGGSGFGLKTALGIVRETGGELQIASDGPGKGAKVTVQLKRCEPPPWFAPRLSIPRNARVAIADDEPSVRETWSAYLSSAHPDGTSIDIAEIEAAPQLEEWYRTESNGRPAFMLVDFELNDSEDGVQVIERLGAQERSVIVTGRFHDQKVRDECQTHGIRMMPKTALGNVNITWT